MKYIKKYNLFESRDSSNDILDIVDCYIDLLDDLEFKRFELKDLPGYKGIPDSEKNSNRPYATIDRIKKVSIPHDSIVFCNTYKQTFNNEIQRDEWLTKANLSYFTVRGKDDEDNPGCSVVIYDSSITKDYDYKKNSTFYFIKDYKLRELMLEGHRRATIQLNSDNQSIYSFDGECTIHYYYNPYRFKRSDLGRDLSRGFINQEEYERLMKTAI